MGNVKQKGGDLLSPKKRNKITFLVMWKDGNRWFDASRRKGRVSLLDAYMCVRKWAGKTNKQTNGRIKKGK